ncbi:MAG: hypothetical protein AAB834_03945, partial [Patescibacteria group bacterium]
GTPDYARMEQDCLNRKAGWVISTARGPMLTNPIRYESKFTGVAYGDYVVCDFITNSCQSVHKKPKEILTVDAWDKPANANAEVPGSETDADGTVEEPELACDVTEGNIVARFTIKWLVCPIVDGATFAVGKFEDIINGLLTVGVEDIFNDTKSDNSFHKAWNSFRFFALGLVVVAALVMVVSQAAGVEILDAYTIRKLLPRLLFAAIFIALSWDVVEFLTTLSNAAGLGIRTLIYAPFQALNANNQLGGGSSFVLALIGSGAAIAFGWVGLLSFALTGLLAALVAFAVLVFRKMLILLLVMMAPFAIACYILPNTQKIWDTWRTGLLSVLIVFPIISAFIAIGRVFAITSMNASGNRIINQLIAIVAYFAPYFLISMAFRLAGGFLATVGGFVNDRSRGAFDRLKNYRGNKVNENMQKMGEGKRFQPSNPLSRAFNATTFGATTFAKSRSKMGFLTNAGTRQSAFEQQRTINAMKYADTDAAKVAQHNDSLLRAQTFTTEADARAGLGARYGMNPEQVESAISAAKANGGFNRTNQVNAVNRLFATGTGFDNLRQAQETVQRVAGGNKDLAAAMVGNGNAVSGTVGRLDLKVGYGEYMKMWQDGEAGTLSDARINEAALEAVKTNDAVSMGRGKPIAMKNATATLAASLEAARATANDPHAGVDDQGRSLQELAKLESGRLAGIIEQYQNAGAYLSPINVQSVQQTAVQQTTNLRQEIQQEASQTVMVRDPATGRLVENLVDVTDPRTGQVVG